MAIEQLSDGRWRVDVEPVKGKRFRRTLKTKAEAIRFEATCRTKLIESPDWTPKPKDQRKLSELVNVWFDLHGVSLTDGKRRKAILLEASSLLGDPVARLLTGGDIAVARAKWLESGVAGKTANNRLGYLKAVYNQLHKLDVIDYECPFEKLSAIKLQEQPLTFLTDRQITLLLAALDARKSSPHPPVVARLCLATGARWGEAQAIGPDQVVDGKVIFSNTKSKRVRAVPISDALEKLLRQHWMKHGEFTNCLMTFTRVLDATIKLPEGQASHVLRHTFASHFVMKGGNILVLQKVLGHSSLAMTMRYAHLSPEHLNEAVALNPFDALSTLKSQVIKNP